MMVDNNIKFCCEFFKEQLEDGIIRNLSPFGFAIRGEIMVHATSLKDSKQYETVGIYNCPWCGKKL